MDFTFTEEQESQAQRLTVGPASFQLARLGSTYPEGLP